jgi:predicted RNA-binding Zn-ribbon protein involved in translation (DUF1610 family)
MKSCSKFFFLGAATLLVSIVALAAPLSFVPQTLKQPDGEVINCFASGDEFYNYLHDKDNYTIIQNSTGFYCYAELIDGKLVASKYIVGVDNPKYTNLKPGINLPSDEMRRIRIERSRIPGNQGSVDSISIVRDGFILARDSIKHKRVFLWVKRFKAVCPSCSKGITLPVKQYPQSGFSFSCPKCQAKVIVN